MRTQLQRSLIRSHAAGMGAPIEHEVVRALMLLRLKTLASGRTGVRPVVAETIAARLNAGITPVVREFGSLGCSGDLAPLSHCALVLMGEGEATGPDGVGRPVPELLTAAGIEPIELQEKEGLALINGTDGMLGMLILAIADLEHLCDVADLTASMSVEALLGTDQVFRPELHLPLRPHPGQALSAANMFAHLRGSGIVASHRVDDVRVQDGLDLHADLGRHEQLVTVHRAGKGHAFFGDLAHLAQRPDLKAARVGQYRFVPLLELVQTAKAFHDVQPGAHPQVEGVAQNDLRTHFVQASRHDAFDGAVSPHGHEDGRFHHAMVQGQRAASGVA